MRRMFALLIGVILLLATGGERATAAPDLTGRLQELFEARARWLLTDGNPPPLEAGYAPGLGKAKWAIAHEKGKIRYVRLWAERRRVAFVEAKPSLYIRQLSGGEERARFYVGQTLMLGYQYPGETTVNRFGVGSRHVVELRLHEGQWLVASEWYSDPLGDETEAPDVLPSAIVPSPEALMVAARRKGYDRAGAVAYADRFCGLAWGCGNDFRYNLKYRNYTGEGGDCTNFLSQILRDGGGLRIPPGIIRVSNMAGYLQASGKAHVVARAPFRQIWQQGAHGKVAPGDLVAYQLKGKMEHFAIITGMDSRGYPLVNSHTADRYRVPFDLGWDKRTIYWFFRMHG